MKRHILRFAQENRRTFELIRDSSKTVETRAGSPRYNDIEVGDTLVFVCGKDRLERIVKRVYRAKNPEEMVTQVPFRRITPELSSEQDAIDKWYTFPGYRDRIAEYGLLGFEI